MTHFFIRWNRVCGEVLPVLVVGLAVFYLIRAQGLEYYRIPSKSMEPVLHGDQRWGDLVLVDKSGLWKGDPEQLDLVVVQGETAGANHMVKRLYAIGPAEVRIAAGDLFIAPPGGTFERLVKSPVEDRDLRVTSFRHPLGPCDQSVDEFFHLPPSNSRLAGEILHLSQPVGCDRVEGLLALLDPEDRRGRVGNLDRAIPGVLSTRNVDSTYLDPEGLRLGETYTDFPDVGIEIDLRTGEPPAALLFALEFHDHDYGLLWQRDGTLELVVEGQPTARESVAPLPERGGRLTFGYLDSHLFLLLDDEVLFHAPVEMLYVAQPRPLTRLHLGVAGGGVQIGRIEVFHDTHISSTDGIFGRDEPYDVPEGSMFLLGDNTYQSSDSRTALGMVPFARLVGRPVAILAPASRARSLAR